MKRKLPQHVWQIETGGHVWYAHGETWEEAIIRAWARKPPEHMGELVRFRKGRHYARTGVFWEYIDPLTALRVAGYSARMTQKGIELQ